MVLDHDSTPSVDDLLCDMPFLLGVLKMVLLPFEGKSGIEVNFEAGGLEANALYVKFMDSTLFLDTAVILTDRNGNAMGIMGNDPYFLLPYLNKGEYTLGLLSISSIVDAPSAPGISFDIEDFGPQVSAVYTVLGNSPLALDLDVGGLYFANEMVNWVFSVTEEGTPYENPLDIAAWLVNPQAGVKVPVPAEDITSIDGFTYVVSATLPNDPAPGTYYLQVAVMDEMYDGFAAKAFQISSGFDNMEAKLNAIIDDIAVLQIAVNGGFLNVNVKLDALALTVEDINGGVIDLLTSMGHVETTVDAIAATVTSIDGRVAMLNTKIGAVQASIDALDAKITALNGTVATISTNLNSLTVDVADIQLTVNSIYDNTVSMSSTLGNITGTLADMKGTLATVNTNLGTVKTEVGNIAGATTGVNSTLAFIILAILIIVAIVLVFIRTKK
jgi:archaellum component FlaC